MLEKFWKTAKNISNRSNVKIRTYQYKTTSVNEVVIQNLEVEYFERILPE